MKITELKVYGQNPKTFLVTVEGYDTQNTDDQIKMRIKIMVHGLIVTLGYENKNINIDNDINIIKYARHDEDTAIYCITNVLNMI